jgi:hypothetical protein
MKVDGTSFGLLGIAAWLIGVVFVGSGQLGIWDAAPAKVTAPSVTVSGPQCTLAYPRGLTPGTIARVTKRPKTCTDGDLQVTWRGCTLRYKA